MKNLANSDATTTVDDIYIASLVINLREYLINKNVLAVCTTSMNSQKN